jgi:nicotinamidase-related amidase
MALGNSAGDCATPEEPRLTKRRPSAFYETGLETLLRGAAVETIVLVGVASYGCIIATYLDACSRGFLTLLCAEGIDGARASLHRAAVEVMGEASRIGAAASFAPGALYPDAA